MSERQFYLGRTYDMQANHVTEQDVGYDPADLTTHAVVTGMTGSGKTGLCIGLLEEAALQHIPAIVIDPKGDLTNLLLHFPALAPADFQPWIDPDLARRAGETVEQAALAASQAWRKGLEQWNINQERLSALTDAAAFAVYTPGSDAGIPVSVLSSLAAPKLDWAENREVLRERVASTVTALLGLTGMDDIDPLQSREHILLSNLFESAWSQGKDLDLTELIMQIQNPPFDKLGAFPVNTFFPMKERTALGDAVEQYPGRARVRSLEGGPASRRALAAVHAGRQAAPQHLLPGTPERWRAHVLPHPAAVGDRNMDAEPAWHRIVARPALYG